MLRNSWIYSAIAGSVGLVVVLSDAPARADEIGPEEAACSELQAGARCTVETFPRLSDGVCVSRTSNRCSPDYYSCIDRASPSCEGSSAANGSGDCVTEAECAAEYCFEYTRLVCEEVPEGSGTTGESGDDEGGCASMGSRLNVTGLAGLAFGAVLVWSARRRRDESA